MLQFCTLSKTPWAMRPRARCPSGAQLKVAEASLRTLGSSYLALQLQEPGGAAAPGSMGTKTLLNILTEATPVSAGVLLILALLSVFCWSIILYKIWVFRRSAKHSSSFLDVFRRSAKFSEVQAVCASLAD